MFVKMMETWGINQKWDIGQVYLAVPYLDILARCDSNTGISCRAIADMLATQYGLAVLNLHAPKVLENLQFQSYLPRLCQNLQATQ